MAKPSRQKDRLEIHLDPPVLQWLRSEATRLGVSVGEMIRQAIAEFIEKPR